MLRRAFLIVCVAAAAGCTKLTAPDGIQIEGVRELSLAGTCQLTMPDGVMGEKGSAPALSSCMGQDTRITGGR
jgi:hypothetical protein